MRRRPLLRCCGVFVCLLMGIGDCGVDRIQLVGDAIEDDWMFGWW
jgi:hypothetical protein